MKENKSANKTYLTDKDLVDALLTISDVTKTLALEVMLLPKENSKDGNEDDSTKFQDTQQKI